MKKCYGIVHSDDGRYVMATMRSSETDAWVPAGITRWQSQNIVRRIMLFQRGITFGSTSWWKPSEFQFPDGTMCKAAADEQSSAFSAVQEHYDIVAYTADMDIHKEAFQSNLMTIVPEDLFLVSLPLYCSSEAGDSFVSVCATAECFFIAVIIERKLLALYRMTPVTPGKLSSYLGRIKRYWSVNFNDIPFPDEVWVVGSIVELPDAVFSKPPVRVAEDEKDIHTLRAMGVALAHKEEMVPSFSGPAPEASFRKKRTLIYGISVGLIIFGLCAIAVFSGINYWFVKKKAAFEAEYQHVIANNQEIKKLTDRNNELAATILRLEETFTRRTLWGRFLHEIGKSKPADLYFERFGSEPIKNNAQAIRIALVGWTPKELSVTKFIANLQDMPYVTQITLSSMERDKKNRSIYGFKILCTLLLNEQ